MEKFKPLQAVNVVYICDKCKEGEVYDTGTMKCLLPPLYVHYCEKCNQSHDLKRVYPYVKYIEVKEKIDFTKAKVNDRIEYIGDSFAYGGTYKIVDMNPEEPSEALVIIEFMSDDTPMFIPIENLNPKEWRLVDGKN